MYKRIFDKKELLDILSKDGKSDIYVIGYYINDKCTLYFDKRDFAKDKVSTEELIQAIQSNKICYKNVPLDLWFEYHQEFCNSLAEKLAKKYGYTHDDMLSDIYYQICLLYRADKYLGSLNYITKSCENFIRLKYKQDKFEKLLRNSVIVSLDTPVSEDEDCLLIDTIADDLHINNIDKLIDKLTSSLYAFGFTMSEIKYILDNKVNMLTYNRYKTYLNWQKLHNLKEFLDDL